MTLFEVFNVRPVLLLEGNRSGVVYLTSAWNLRQFLSPYLRRTERGSGQAWSPVRRGSCQPRNK